MLAIETMFESSASDKNPQNPLIFLHLYCGTSQTLIIGNYSLKWNRRYIITCLWVSRQTVYYKETNLHSPGIDPTILISEVPHHHHYTTAAPGIYIPPSIIRVTKVHITYYMQVAWWPLTFLNIRSQPRDTSGLNIFLRKSHVSVFMNSFPIP